MCYTLWLVTGIPKFKKHQCISFAKGDKYEKSFIIECNNCNKENKVYLLYLRAWVEVSQRTEMHKIEPYRINRNPPGKLNEKRRADRAESIE